MGLYAYIYIYTYSFVYGFEYTDRKKNQMCIMFEALVCSRGNPPKLYPMPITVSEKHFIQPLSQNVAGIFPESTCERGTNQTPQSNRPAWTINLWKFFPDLAIILDVGLPSVDNQSTMQPTNAAKSQSQNPDHHCKPSMEVNSQSKIFMVVHTKGNRVFGVRVKSKMRAIPSLWPSSGGSTLSFI